MFTWINKREMNNPLPRTFQHSIPLELNPFVNAAQLLFKIIPGESTILRTLNTDEFMNCKIRNLMTGSASCVILSSIY